ncbi:MAG: hypothetical protein U5L96_15525 [Owenweeksia sp.]|nr:hypothetical protein [Owenweeksia sp.]
MVPAFALTHIWQLFDAWQAGRGNAKPGHTGSTNPDYRYELAMAHLQNSQPQEAIAQLDELESFLGVNEAISNKKKEIYLDLGKLENAAIGLRG